MFVSMIFTKFGVPTAGKWKGMKWVGTHYDRRDGGSSSSNNSGGMMKKGKRFTRDDGEEVSLEEESRVLKPCVYKVR